MAILEPRPAPVTEKDLRGTVWGPIASLGGQVPPFALDAPGEFDNANLAAGEVKRMTYSGSGRVLTLNIDLPAGVTLRLSCDGQSRFFSKGNEAGIERWTRDTAPYKFDNQILVEVTNTTGVGQTYLVHITGA